MAEVLIIEDEVGIAESLAYLLRLEGFSVRHARRLAEGRDAAPNADLIVLDLTLPDGSGLELLRQLRTTARTPVIILTGIAEMTPRIKGFGHGADDYLVKPVDKRELLARVQAIVRRAKGHCNSIIEIGRISINIHTRAVAVDGQPLHLTQREYCILELLALRRGMVQTKEALMNHLYGGSEEPGFKIVDVFLCKLRKKLLAVCGESYIETQWGRGYVLRAPEGARDISPPQAA